MNCFEEKYVVGANWRGKLLVLIEEVSCWCRFAKTPTTAVKNT